MKILIVDANLVYANKVRSFIEEHTKQSEVEVAYNIPIMLERLARTKYDLIIIDYGYAKKSDVLTKLTHIDTPKIIWAVHEGELAHMYKKPNYFVRNKPVCDKEMPTALAGIAGLAVGVY